VILHNIATTLGLPEPDSYSDDEPEDSSDSEPDDNDDEQGGLNAGRLARERIVARYFQQ